MLREAILLVILFRLYPVFSSQDYLHDFVRCDEVYAQLNAPLGTIIFVPRNNSNGACCIEYQPRSFSIIMPFFL